MKAILQVSVDEKNNVSIQYSGQPNSLLSVLGGLDVAKDWVLKCIHNRTSKEEIKPVENEVKVSRKEAMDFYLGERQVIEDRLKSIAESDDMAEFIINPLQK